MIEKRLLKVLAAIDRPGSFCVSGRVPAVFPGLEVAGEGRIALPLAAGQASALKKLARQAPYGKGTKTLVDVDVRRVWEIDADRICFANPEWNGVLSQVLDGVQAELGLEKQKLAAHLYKLLLYDAGSFFLPHRDGEKLDRMVATLVVALPSPHSGGVLVVRHDGREKRVDFGPESAFQSQFAAFYADCEHEVLPVESGFRLALVYNLTLEKSKERITAPLTRNHVAAAAEVLQHWKSAALSAARRAGEAASIEKLAVALDHKYTAAGLSLAALKGLDRAKAEVLFAAAREAECDAYLALAVQWESGGAEPADGGYGGSDEEDEEGGEYEMTEVYDHTLVLQDFRDPEGAAMDFGELPLEPSEFVSKKPLDQGAPDREEFEGYTGNAGMTLERWYRRAVVALWPAGRRFDVLCEAGVHAAVGGLAGMVGRWKSAEPAAQPSLKQECLDFADRILAHWPPQESAPSYADAERGPHQFLALLAELGDPSRIAAWIRDASSRDATIDYDERLGDLCEVHGWETFTADLVALFRGTTAHTLVRQARFLADWSCRSGDGGRAELCGKLAETLLSVVEKSSLQPPAEHWKKPEVDLPDLLSLLLKSLLALEQDLLLERLRTYVSGRPEVFDVTTVQAPTFEALQPWLKKRVGRARPPLSAWLASLRAAVEAKAAAAPQPPADERRSADLDCKCQDCAALRRFLEDPRLTTLRLPAASVRRAHLHHVVDRLRLDTTHVTERIGRPFTLVFRKTTASYQAALKAHQVDLQQLERLRELEAWHGGLPSAAPGSERKAAAKKANAKKATASKTAAKKASKKPPPRRGS